MIWFFHKCCTD